MDAASHMLSKRAFNMTILWSQLTKLCAEAKNTDMKQHFRITGINAMKLSSICLHLVV